MPPDPLTITDAASLLRRGELTPSDLLEQCLARVDVYEPKVQAWAYLDRERSRQDAAKATEDIRAGRYLGPLHGIPVGIKDIIDVFDMPTGCGSKLWANSYARRDATCVKRLRDAGAIILGKTVTTPYAYLDPPPTRNPWNLDHTPGGSSSGSAAAVACGMVLAALGTQTGGSLTRPASYCGVYSLKPSFGRVPTEGVLPLSHDLDHVGVMANCVRDLALAFHVVAGADSGAAEGDWPVPDCVHAIDNRRYGPDFAVIRGVFEESATTEMQSALSEFRRRADEADYPLGFHDIVPPGSFVHVHRWHRTMMAVGAAAVHAERFDRHPTDYPPLIAGLIDAGRRHTGLEYDEAWVRRIAVRDEIDGAIRRLRIWLTPAAIGSAPAADTTGIPVMNAPWSYLGVPTVSVPFASTSDGLPLAVQLIAETRGEDRLLAAAAELERVAAVPRRLPPVP